MRKTNVNKVLSAPYDRLAEIRMSEADRIQALRALKQAETLVDLIQWVSARLAAVGDYFLKPSLKH